MRVGYYVNNEYTEEQLANEPPAKPIIEKVRRVILAEKPRVTRFGIKWDSEESAPAEFPPDQPEADAAEDDETTYGAGEEVEDGQEAPELVEGGEKAVVAEDDDAEMEGTEKKVDDDAASDAGSEDLEAESSGSEDEEEEEEEAEGEQAEEDIEMGEGGDDKSAQAASTKPEGKENVQQPAADVMVH